jgi:hypothetical protein
MPLPRCAAANLAGVPVASVGEAYDLTYPVEQLGEGADALDKLAKAGRWAPAEAGSAVRAQACA